MRYLLCLLLAFAVTSVSADETLKSSQFKYANAKAMHDRTGRPLVVVLGAVWCGPCQAYKADAITKLAAEIRQGTVKCHLAVVDVDVESDLAKKVRGADSGPLPFTAIYYSTRTKKKKKHFYERHSLDYIKLVLKDIESERR